MINQTFFLSVPDILELIFNYKKDCLTLEEQGFDACI